MRRVSGRVDRYRDVDMAMRWAATGFLEAEKRFRKLGGADEPLDARRCLASSDR
ncbi:MAG: hypothetical protein VB137_05165 [Burkholderia sp.]